jgi:hypothetical protein
MTMKMNRMRNIRLVKTLLLFCWQLVSITRASTSSSHLRSSAFDLKDFGLIDVKKTTSSRNLHTAKISDSL